MARPLSVLLNNNNPGPILWEESENTAFKALKESLMNSPALGWVTTIIGCLFSFCIGKEVECLCGIHPKTQRWNSQIHRIKIVKFIELKSERVIKINK